MLVQDLSASAFRAFPACTRTITSAKRRLINQHRFNPIHTPLSPKSPTSLAPSVPEGDSAPAFSPTARRLPLRPPPGRIPLHIPPVFRSPNPEIISKVYTPDSPRLSRRVTKLVMRSTISAIAMRAINRRGQIMWEKIEPFLKWGMVSTGWRKRLGT